MTCPRCNNRMQEENDGVSYYRLCRICGHLENLTASGQVYQPPAELDPEDRSNLVQRREHRNAEHQPQSRRYRDGCRAHDHCLTCPFVACIIADREAYQSALRATARAQWFQGKSLAEIKTEDVQALAAQEGVGERSIWRRLQKMRAATAGQTA